MLTPWEALTVVDVCDKYLKPAGWAGYSSPGGVGYVCCISNADYSLPEYHGEGATHESSFWNAFKRWRVDHA